MTIELLSDTAGSLHAAIQDTILLKLVCFAVALSIAVTTISSRWSRRKMPLPPGPRSLPYIGYRFGPYPWREMERITRKYGPVSKVMMGSTPLIIVGTVKDAIELLEHKGAIYASRPRLEMSGAVMSGGMRTLSLEYGERWLKFRKALHSQLDGRAAASYQIVQEKAARQVILDILDRRANFEDALTTYAASVILKIAYGKASQTTYDDPEVRQVNLCLKRFTWAARPGTFTLDRHPWLKFVPFWTSTGRRWHQEELSLFRSQIQNVRKSRGERDTCVVSHLLDKQKDLALSDDELAYLAGSLFGAGSDTTSAALSIVVFAAACFPEEVKKVQEELDRVVGRDRLPTFSDHPELPCVTAFYNESFRWRPVSAAVTSGFMHAAIKDDHHKGHFIPAGSWILGNHWSINRDPSVYPEPDEFKPSRWLNVDEKTGEVSLRSDIRHFAYGFGRRRCPGQIVADNSVFINTANLLCAFEIRRKRSADGNDIPLDSRAFTDSANSRPLPFEVDFVPRHSHLRSMIEEMGTSRSEIRDSN
ncbi:uncharacterized protein MELLADRAFT_123434 [Melampsora larici-populina 98AG31]|uniref:Cytochrome P450 monooxygenase n=1 Tax=Melampsora larici-populina (strain 98AG31 / pathotype 3-4-7) TaxID=747676 RepID=F4S2H4_MELLP|nr:uncharacterized protein MELLADRAFT_123434 [Melampsora larici-populina 98AG31]EGG01204.1 hypothetical protein MELLADRAFT_123434 [Melampsora larici-populina 98AG31]